LPRGLKPAARVRVTVIGLMKHRASALRSASVESRKFEADYVIYLEVLKFQMRDPSEPQFLKGRIEASVTVHDIHADPDQLRRYELAPVRCIHPDGSPVLLSRTNAPLVREATYRKFAEQVARKFYEHTVEL